MILDPLAITVNLTNEKVQFTGALRDNAPITVDYTPPLGDGQGYTSLELFLVSLATCSGTSVLILLRKMGKAITAFQVEANGVRRTQHPTGFEQITLTFTLTAADLAEAEVQQAIDLSESTFCPVWAMIKGNVEVQARFRILTPTRA